MDLLSKLVALTLFAAGTATVASAAPSPTQPNRGIPGGGGVPPAPVCCTPATKIIATGSAGWTVRRPAPNTATLPAVQIVPTHPLWATLPGSQWIADNANAGQANEPAGIYTYTYTFCLCDAPDGMDVPAKLSLHVYADDNFRAKLNGVAIGGHPGGWGFTSSSPPAPAGAAAPPGGTFIHATAHFKKCVNTLTFEVKNGLSSPTGLDVYGTIAGYFRQPAPGLPCCPAGPPPPYDPTANPN